MASQVPRIARFTLAAALVYGVGKLVTYASPTSIFSILELIGAAGLTVSLAYYGFQILRWVQGRLLWKVRNKVIVSFAFVGLIPVALLLLIAWTSMDLIFKQVSVLNLEAELKTVADSLHQASREILIEYYRERPGPAESLPLLRQEMERIWVERHEKLPDLHFFIYHRPLESKEFQLLETFPSPLPGGALAGSTVSPSWVQGSDIQGLVLESGAVRFEVITPISGAEELLFSIRVPLGERLLQQFQKATSADLVLTSFNPAGNEPEFQMVYSSFFGQRSLFSVGSVYFFTPQLWSDGGLHSENIQAILLSVPMWTLLENLFRQAAGPAGSVILIILASLAAAFVVVEGISFFLGAAIALSLTRSIHNIYEGTLRLREGGFGYRIPSRSRDQLDAVADSFNEMSENIIRLMTEVSAKEWISREIQIAREVQFQLFPQELPRICRLQMAATCLPARQVSGDYYDFLSLDSHRLDVVLGDISGKGIAAALLMASLQSWIRSRLLISSSEPGPGRMQRAAREINRQVYRQTSAEKYSTLVLAHFDMGDSLLTYCTAGNNPPLLLSGERVERLEQGGTVVGLFEDCSYEEGSVRLRPHDIVLFYTDGVIEAENEAEEQFGEERLVRTVKGNEFLTAEDIQASILDELTRWQGPGEPSDDITVLVFKVLPE